MPLFYKLDGFGEDTARIAGRLAALIDALQNDPEEEARCVPDKNATETLLLATWNLKAFDGGASDNRTEEFYWYIAEIISHFDIVAIQELLGHAKIELTMRYSKLSGLKAQHDYYQAMEKITANEIEEPTADVPPTRN